MGYNVLIIWSNKQSDWKTDLYNGAEVCKQTVKQVYIVNFFFYHILIEVHPIFIIQNLTFCILRSHDHQYLWIPIFVLFAAGLIRETKSKRIAISPKMYWKDHLPQINVFMKLFSPLIARKLLSANVNW